MANYHHDLIESVDFSAEGLEGWSAVSADCPMAMGADIRFLARANSPASVALFDRLNRQLTVRLSAAGYVYRVAIHWGERRKTPAIDCDEVVYEGRVVGIEATTADFPPPCD